MTDSVDAAYHWQSEELDLDAYLDRIGYSGARPSQDSGPTVATLRALQRAHTTSIPFENLELMLGRPILIDLATVQAKIVRQRRGYCYENIALFAAALERFGFGITGLSARVTLGAGTLRPATHSILLVTTADDDRRWLCDVGFGRGPLAPLELVPGEVDQSGWRFRLQQVTDDRWILHQHGPDGWIDRHTFTLNPQYRLDYAVGNHYVSTSSHSPFTARPFVQRFHPDRHEVLDDTTWTTTTLTSTKEQQLTPADLPKILTEYFDIDLADADADALVTASWRT